MKTSSAGFVLISALLSVAALAGACLPVPPSPSEPGAAPQGAAPQNVAPTAEFTAIPVEPSLLISPVAPADAAGNDCPGVDSTLMQIIESPDPIALARQLQVAVKDEKIQVVLLLNQPDPSFLRDYGAEVGTQADMQVQAFVPPGQLCDLANSGQVLTIGLPANAVLQ